MRIFHIDGIRGLETTTGAVAEIVLREQSGRITLDAGVSSPIRLSPEQAEALAAKLLAMAERIRKAVDPEPPT
jgi:predicted DNA-binding transcriptional regulator YafY